MFSKKEVIGNVDGNDIVRITLTNENGMEVRLLNIGATITHLFVPDSKGELGDIVLGYDNYEDYLRNPAYFGSVCGRYANRIANAKFSLLGEDYQLTENDGQNCLHGGENGFHKKIWKVNICDEGMVEFACVSEDGEEGFPGKLRIRVRYVISDRDELTISYFANASTPTIINLTNHTYFNLAGEGSETALNQILTINATTFLPINEAHIPTGERRTVKNTPLDFTAPKRIGAQIDWDDAQVALANGYDFNYILDKKTALTRAAILEDPQSGRKMEVHTTEPALQLYSGSYLDGSEKGKNGHAYGKSSGVCLETQHYPDSPNRPEFPNTVLKKGQEFFSITTFRFGSAHSE